MQTVTKPKKQHQPRPVCTTTYCPQNPPTLSRHPGRKCRGCFNVRYI